MICGHGIDIVSIERIRGMLHRHGAHFTHKVFTPSEIDYCGKMAQPEIHFAGRWAVKEAFYKSLPQSCQKYSGWKSIEILNSEPQGAPRIEISSDILKEQLLTRRIASFLVSISHEKEFCIGSVIAVGKSG